MQQKVTKPAVSHFDAFQLKSACIESFNTWSFFFFKKRVFYVQFV